MLILSKMSPLEGGETIEMREAKKMKMLKQSLCILSLLSLMATSSVSHAGAYRPATCDQYAPQILHQMASRYRHVIHSASHKYGVNANLIKAVITAETCFRPRARSHKGAAGLMQLMPATARRWGVTNRYNIAQNIHGGTLYLRWLLDRYGGSVRHAVAAYNSGEGTVDKYGLQVPYRETQNYLRQVMNAYIKMNGGRAPEFMPGRGMVRANFKQSVTDSANQYPAMQLQELQAQVDRDRAARDSKNSSRKTSRRSRSSKRLLPSCLTASKKLHRATYHSDRKGVRTFYYKVEKGDSLGKIMQKTGRSTRAIKDYNDLKRNLIRPGDKLKVAECSL